MKRYLLLILACLAVFFVAACSKTEQSKQGAEPTPSAAGPDQAAPPATPNEQLAIGQLKDVDLKAGTFTLKEADGNEVTFAFSESTEIVGASGTQGLTGQQGTHIMVLYIKQGDVNRAVRIELSSTQK